MKVVRKGHTYALPHFVNPDHIQVIQFLQKESNGEELVLVKDGIINEQLIEMLIDRIEFLNQLVPSDYNDDALHHLNKALEALNERTLDRAVRGVKGKYFS